MKRYNYSIALSLNCFTGVIFILQFILEFGGLINRKPGYELVVPICGVAFLLSIIYSFVSILLNAKNKHTL